MIKNQSTTAFSTNHQINSHLSYKLALLCFGNDRPSQLFESFLVILEYLQLLTQALYLQAEKCSNDSESSFCKKFDSISKLVNPFYFLAFEQASSALVTSIFAFIIAITGIKYLLVGYVLISLKNDQIPMKQTAAAFKLILKMQGRIFYLLFSSLWLNMIAAENLVLWGFGREGTVTFCCFFIFTDVILSLFFQLYCQCILPTKSLLSSKDNYLQIITFSQKVLMQLLQISFGWSLITRDWIIRISNFILSGYKIRLFFQTLPLYKLRALYLQNYLLIITFTFDTSALVQIAIRSSANDTNLTLALWFTTACLGIKLMKSVLTIKLMNLATRNIDQHRPELLLHKISIIKQMRKTTVIPDPHNDEYHFSYLLNQTINAYVNMVHGTPNDEFQFSINTPQSLNTILAKYLEDLLERFPKNDCIKLHAAYFYGTKLHNYTKALKILAELPHHNWSPIALCIPLIEAKIQELFKKNSNQSIDMNTYLKTHYYIVEYKHKMRKQAKAQIKVCEQVLNENSDLEKIIQSATYADLYRNKVLRRLARFPQVLPTTCIKPYLLSAYYELILNHSVLDYQSYMKIYYQKQQNCFDYFQSNKLIPENLYQAQNVFLVLSAQKHNLGEIVYCCKTDETILASSSQTYLGKKTSSLFLPKGFSLEDKLTSMIDAENDYASEISRGYVHHQNGYMVQVDYFMSIYPVFTHGFFLSLILREVPFESKDYLLLHENGDIEGATKNISDKLGLAHKQININAISGELHLIIQAFRKNSPIVTSNQRKSFSVHSGIGTLKLEKKKSSTRKSKFCQQETSNLHSIYADEGGLITFTPLLNASITDDCIYHCIVNPQVFQGSAMKLVVLEKFEQELQEEGNNINNEFIPGDSTQQMKKTQAQTQNQHHFPLPPPPSSSNLRRVLQNSSDLIPSEREGFITSRETSELQSSMSSSRKIKIIRAKPKMLTPKAPLPKRMIVEIVGSKSSSKTGNQTKIFKAFRTALQLTYQPRFFRILCVIFYLLLLFLIVSQFAIKILINRADETLQVRKNVLVNAQLRTLSAIQTQMVFRQIWSQGTGAISKQEFGLIARPLSVYFKIIKQFIDGIIAGNAGVLKNSNALDQETRSLLFQKNIKMYDDPTGASYRLMTSFEATQKVIDVALTGYSTGLANLHNIPVLKPLFYYLLRNVPNDLYLKNDKIITNFVSSVADQLQDIETKVLIYLIFALVFIAIISVTVNILIWMQYFEDKNNLIGFTKLNRNFVSNVMNRTISFRIALKRQAALKDYEKFTADEVSKDYNLIIKHKSNKSEILSNKKYLSSGLHRRFLLYSARWIVFTTILIGLLLWAAVSTIRRQTTLKDKITLLNLGYHATVRTNFDFTLATEVFFENGTSYIDGQLTSIRINDALDDITYIRNIVVDLFTDNEFTQDETIRTLLYGDSCKLLDPLSYTVFCNTLRTYQMRTGLIELFGYAETLIREKQEDYKYSNKTAASLHLFTVKNFDVLTSLKRVITGSTTLMLNTVNENMDQYIVSGEHSRQTTLVVVLIYLGVLAVLVWMYIFRVLKIASNQFKKVLKTLPVQLVLSNFFLKSFLIKTSFGAFDSSRDIIV